MDRRTLLTGIGGLVTVGLTGCLGTPGGPNDTPSETPSSTPSDSGPHPVTPTDREFSVLSRECGQGENAATVVVDGDTVTVEGTIGGSDTCDTAHLRRIELEDGTLSVRIAAAPVPTTETPACAQCLTDIEYQLDVTVGRSALDRVVVTHLSGGDSITVADEAVSGS